VIAGPVIDRPYDTEKEKRLIRAAKKKKLEDLEGESLLGTAGLFTLFIWRNCSISKS
jgi:hypothetical protein